MFRQTGMGKQSAVFGHLTVWKNNTFQMVGLLQQFFQVSELFAFFTEYTNLFLMALIIKNVTAQINKKPQMIPAYPPVDISISFFSGFCFTACISTLWEWFPVGKKICDVTELCHVRHMGTYKSWTKTSSWNPENVAKLLLVLEL